MTPLVAEGAPTTLVERALGPSGRTHAEYLALRTVSARGPFASLAELVDHLVLEPQLRLDRPAATRLVERLRIEGMVRSAPVLLTRYGADVLDGLTRDVMRGTVAGPALLPPG